MEQVQKRRSEKIQAAQEESVRAKKDSKAETDKQAADELLDAIDDLLEENAEAFVHNYIQAGGQ